MTRYILVKLDPEDDFMAEVPAFMAMVDGYPHADVTCFVGCEGLDFKSLTDLLLP